MPPRTPTTVRRTLAGEEGPVRDIVLLNAAAGLVSWELAQDAALAEEDIRARFRAGIARAAEAVDSGAATAKLDAWIAATAASPVDYSTQSKERVTARFHWRIRSSRSAASISGSQRVSSRQFARSSSRSFQNPTASPAA